MMILADQSIDKRVLVTLVTNMAVVSIPSLGVKHRANLRGNQVCISNVTLYVFWQRIPLLVLYEEVSEIRVVNEGIEHRGVKQKHRALIVYPCTLSPQILLRPSLFSRIHL